MHCEIKESGYLYMPAKIANRYFNTTAIIVRVMEDELHIMPISHVGAGGLILKYRNSEGDRTVLLKEFLPENISVGKRSVSWDEKRSVLRVPLYV